MKSAAITRMGISAAVSAIATFAIAAWVSPPVHSAETAPPNLIVVGKTVNYRQSADGRLTLLNYHFFAEVFQPSSEAGGSAELISPRGPAIRFRADGSVLGAGGDLEFRSLAELNGRMPNGRYTVRYDRPGAPQLVASVKMNATAGAMADAVRIRLLQEGREVAASAVDPAHALVIRWSPFTKGRPDPNGISDDLIFVHVGDCRGRIRARTPAPFSGNAPLFYRSASYTVSAGTLGPGSIYQISVEQAPVATSRTEGVPTFATSPRPPIWTSRPRARAPSRAQIRRIKWTVGKAIGSALRNALLGLILLVPAASDAETARAAPAASEVSFFAVVKSSNYSQKADGELTLLNYHFFSEVFPVSGAPLRGELTSPYFERPKAYQQRDRTLYVEGGHFPDLAALDAAYPNGIYRVSIDDSRTRIANGSLDLRGDGGVTAIPEPIHIAIGQGGTAVAPTAIDASQPMTIRWNRFSNGRSDPRGIVDDMIFVVIQDCHGRNVFHTGLPFDGKYLRYDALDVQVPAHLLEPGRPYSMFVEMPHVVDSIRSQGIPGLASFATATYLDLRTLGTASTDCPAALPPMDTGQTDRGGAVSGTDATMSAKPSTASDTRISGQVTFLYFGDLAAPRKFYGQTLGLVPYLENGWVTLYRTTSGATIGLVKAPNGRTSAAMKRSVVMVSLVTDDVEAWYRKLARDRGVRIVKPLYDHPGVPIRAFEIEDPAGYPIEFFQWIDPAQAKSAPARR
jgi:hypothetical protein